MKIMWLVVFGLLIASAVMAAVPNQMSVQGRLTNAGGPMNGSHPAEFKIYDAESGGTLLWTETSSLVVQSGVFSAIIGSTIPIPTIVFGDQPRWLEVTVDGSTLSPRLPLTTNAYAFRAQHADTADFAHNAPSGDNLWSTNGTNVWRQNGNVGILTNTPQFPLDVRGNVRLSSYQPNNIALTIEGPNQPFDTNSAQDIRFSFDAAGSSGIRSYRGLSWDTHLQFLTNSYGQGSDNPQPRMTITDAGKVGIGLTNPATNLDMVGNFKLRLQPVGDNSGMSFNAAPESPSIGFHASDNSQRFTLATAISAINGNDQLRFDGSVAGSILALKGDGKVGIGTSSPTDKLEVAGNVTIGPQDGTLNDVVLRAAGGCANCGGNSEGGSHLVLRSGIGTGAAASGDIVFQVSDNVNYGNQQPHAVLEGMRIQTGTGNVSIAGSLSVVGTKCRVVMTDFGQLKMNAVESAHALFMDDEPSARLVNGRCRVNLSPKFLATVTVNGKYPLAVSVTFYGHHGGGWYVERDATGFTVIDPSGSDAEFSWQTIARQKGYEDTNLEPVTQTAAR